MSHEIPRSPDTPDFGDFDPEALEYLQEINDAFDRLPEELENRKAAYLGNVFARKNAIEKGLENLGKNCYEFQNKINEHQIRVQESNTKLAFEQYIDILFMLPEEKVNDRARALESALRSADEAQAALNERNTGFRHHFDPSTLREAVENITLLDDTIEAASQAYVLYDNLVRPVDHLRYQLENNNPDSL